ncbi:hypothetical protein O181_011160 [Austropuccinia psidii MF-1]|uniref:Uncharacterized protein n=1 Tax=Austropuccinia psidii MF-1 TaxID=1389203 RepID=A0A9Q3GLM4_9BASI|nr:hypothetical protein [Austropuccinia psidii MF-1]
MMRRIILKLTYRPPPLPNNYLQLDIGIGWDRQMELKWKDLLGDKEQPFASWIQQNIFKQDAFGLPKLLSFAMLIHDCKNASRWVK